MACYIQTRASTIRFTDDRHLEDVDCGLYYGALSFSYTDQFKIQNSTTYSALKTIGVTSVTPLNVLFRLDAHSIPSKYRFKKFEIEIVKSGSVVDTLSSTSNPTPSDIFNLSTYYGNYYSNISIGITARVYVIEELRITFDANGGTGAPADITFEAGSSVTIPSQTPEKQGEIFQNWLDEETGTTYSAGQIVSGLENSLTLVAQYGDVPPPPPAGNNLLYGSGNGLLYGADGFLVYG